jgi:haloacid dehalogenase superfamily, subfamily IA, variant 3 with third motif having DD or ED
MIKNIVFDLGNVLLSFKPSEYFDKHKYPAAIKATILEDIFRSKEWLMLDNGEISTQDAINAISKRSSLKKEEIDHIFNLRTDLLFPLDSNIKMLPGLKKRGFKLYYLSNFPLDIFDEVRSGYYFFRYFDGGLISAEAKSSKPDTRIYELLLERYSLIPGECLFIDDLEANVISARTFGMKVFLTNGSLEIAKEIEEALM